MAKIAVIHTGGKQYKVKEGQTISIEKLGKEDGETVKFDTFLIADSETGEAQIGKPSLGELVSGKVLEEGQGDKVLVVKYKSKTRYMKRVGHRQLFTKVLIENIA